MWKLTIMVNNPKRLVSLDEIRIRRSGDRQIITNGPLYDLNDVQRHVRQHGLRVVNEDAQNDQINDFDPVLVDEELADFICALRPDLFHRSERCATSVGMTVECDAYVMGWNRITCREWASGKRIYVKFGFRDNNPRCLVVSIHYAKP